MNTSVYLICQITKVFSVSNHPKPESFLTIGNFQYNPPNTYPELIVWKFVLTVSSPLLPEVDFSHQPHHSFLKAVQPNTLAIIKLYASNTDTHIFPLEPPHHTLLQIIYNQIHVVQLICTPHFTQQHYPPHKSKQYPPLSDAEPSLGNNSLSTTHYI